MDTETKEAVDLMMPDTTSLKREANDMMTLVQNLAVTDQVTHDQMVEYGSAASGFIRDVEKRYGQNKDHAHKAWKGWCALMEDLCAIPEQVKKLAGNKTGVWRQAEKERAERLTREANERIRKQADEDRIAEIARLEQERQRDTAALLEQAQVAEQSGRHDVASALVEQAVIAEQTNQQAVAAVVSAPIIAPHVVVLSTAQKPKGAADNTPWKFTIVDAAKLPREYLMADLVKIGGVVRAKKQAGEVIPGVNAYPDYGTKF
jgi:hypothetical protein